MITIELVGGPRDGEHVEVVLPPAMHLVRIPRWRYLADAILIEVPESLHSMVAAVLEEFCRAADDYRYYPLRHDTERGLMYYVWDQLKDAYV